MSFISESQEAKAEVFVGQPFVFAYFAPFCSKPLRVLLFSKGDRTGLNQVEIWFSKVERDVIARGIFTSVKDLARKLRRYINAYSANAKPI